MYILVYVVHQRTYALGNFLKKMIFPFSKLNLKVKVLTMHIKILDTQKLYLPCYFYVVYLII